MDAAALRDVLAAGRGADVVCAQAGDVNTGACDHSAEIVDAAAARRRLGPRRRRLRPVGRRQPRAPPLLGGSRAPTPGRPTCHKWLNVPYDCGLAFVADPEPHRAAMAVSAAYLRGTREGERDGSDWMPEFSRRARGFAVYAALRSLGREGVAELVERCCACARRFAEVLGAERRSRSSTTSCSTRCSSASATTTRRPTPWWPPCRPRARAG